jgi:hypothetical protein
MQMWDVLMAHVIRFLGVSMMQTHIPKYNQNSGINMAEIWQHG